MRVLVAEFEVFALFHIEEFGSLLIADHLIDYTESQISALRQYLFALNLTVIHLQS